MKASILRKLPTESFGGRAGHNLEHLHKRYSNLYPGEAMQFNIPFKRETPDTSALDSQVAEELLIRIAATSNAMPEDQLYRYPVNVEGKGWEARLAFEPHSFRKILQNLQHQLDALNRHFQGD